jgi:hypothetical protein
LSVGDISGIFMKPEQQRIAIAETCGWYKFVVNSLGEQVWHKQVNGNQFYDLLVASLKELPDYLNDLNAMQAAERVLTNEQCRYYASMLVNVHPLKYSPVGVNVADAWMKLFLIASMTAAQRAEAFLRAVGRWEESK